MAIEHVLLLVAVAFTGGLFLKASSIDSHVRRATTAFTGKSKHDRPTQHSSNASPN